MLIAFDLHHHRNLVGKLITCVFQTAVSSTDILTETTILKGHQSNSQPLSRKTNDLKHLT